MKRVYIIITLIIIAIIALFIYKKSEVIENDKTIISEEFDALLADERLNSEDDVTAAEIQTVAIQKVEDIINNQSSTANKKKAAASSFMGFYLANYRTRSQYCLSVGYDIINFKTIFQDRHKEEIAIAQELLFQTENDIDSFYELVKSESEKAIQKDMEDMAAIYEITPKEACKIINENAESLIDELQLSKAQPLVYKYLHIPSEELKKE